MTPTGDPRDKEFVDAVMRQIATRRLPRRSWWRRMFAAREVTLRFRPASWALAALSLVLLGALVARSRHPGPTVTVTATHQAPSGDVPTLVRFTLNAPSARGVALAGDFNGWRPDVTPLRRGGDGLWIVEVPLTRGNWSYSFVVDGKWVEDPLAESWRADGFGGKNAVVRVGDAVALMGEARGG
jgi:hypothetical protein